MRRRRLVALLGLSIVLVLAHSSWSETSQQLLAPFVFHDPGQPPLLILRCGALFFSLYVLRDQPARAMVIIALFLLSLGARGFLYPFLIAGCVVAPRRDTDATPYTVLFGALATALALVVLPHLRGATAAPDPRDPAKMVAYWRSRHNAHQARWWALEWGRREKNGEAYLALAAIDWELGRRTQARKVLAKVLDHPTSEAVRAKADAQRALWDASEAP